MSDEHEHHPHAHEHDAPETRDAGSQALAEALHSSFAIVKVVMVLMVLAFFASGIFQVGPQEKAVILRLGKPVGVGPKQLLGAGLHWSLPYPIDQVIKIPISELQHVESTAGWYYTTPEEELTGESQAAAGPLNPAIDGYALSADTNIVHVRVRLFYRIEDPLTAVFGFANDTNFTYGLAGVSNAVQNVLNNALLYTAAYFNEDDILTRNVGEFRAAVQRRVEELIDSENLGISIDNCAVDTAPPRQLADVFQKVTEASENRNKALINAEQAKDKILSDAGATAAAITNAAEIARNRYVTELSAEAKKFSDLLPQYETNQDLFVKVEVAQTMAQVLTNAEKWVEPTSIDGKGTEVRLMLNREPPAPKKTTATGE
jgi:modulator of FtsH protease HflK